MLVGCSPDGSDDEADGSEGVDGAEVPHGVQLAAESIDDVTGSPISLYEIEGELVGFAFERGEAITVLRSSDNGESWSVDRPAELQPASESLRWGYQFGSPGGDIGIYQDGPVFLTMSLLPTGTGPADLHPDPYTAPVFAAISTDAARTWRVVDLPGPEGWTAYPLSLAVTGERIVIGGSEATPGEPLDSAELFDAAVWYSDDDGASWSRSDSTSLAMPSGDQEIRALVENEGTLIAAGVDTIDAHADWQQCCRWAEQIVVWLSDDAGASWRRAEFPMLDMTTPVAEEQGRLVLTSSNGHLVLENDGYWGEAYSSSDQGETWETGSPPPSDSDVPVLRLNTMFFGDVALEVGINNIACDCLQVSISTKAVDESWDDRDEELPIPPCDETTTRPRHGLYGPPLVVPGTADTFVALGFCLHGDDYVPIVATARGIDGEWSLSQPENLATAGIVANDNVGSLVEVAGPVEVEERLVALVGGQTGQLTVVEISS
ncbi:MAG: hypothetical protein DCC48_06960 [Acidobacteria bacterium]|nr:MAG: hypothetical protein DCC48_06960 [Acidobacteriota bacterium]